MHRPEGQLLLPHITHLQDRRVVMPKQTGAELQPLRHTRNLPNNMLPLSLVQSNALRNRQDRRNKQGQRSNNAHLNSNKDNNRQDLPNNNSHVSNTPQAVANIVAATRPSNGLCPNSNNGLRNSSNSARPNSPCHNNNRSNNVLPPVAAANMGVIVHLCSRKV